MDSDSAFIVIDAPFEGAKCAEARFLYPDGHSCSAVVTEVDDFAGVVVDTEEHVPGAVIHRPVARVPELHPQATDLEQVVDLAGELTSLVSDLDLPCLAGLPNQVEERCDVVLFAGHWPSFKRVFMADDVSEMNE